MPSGFPQSLSGSETDVSTSNENLSREERYVVRHTARVEPQGQENQAQPNNNNNRNSLKVILQYLYAVTVSHYPFAVRNLPMNSSFINIGIM